MAGDTGDCRIVQRVRSGKHYLLTWIMSNYGQKLCVLLALIFTVIAVLSNRTPVLQKVTKQLQFFSFSSPVVDFYDGDLASLIEKLEESEISAVMYYAPWSAESMHVRWEFDRTARFFNNQITFLAINCWWAEGTCRQKQKITTFPLIYIYPHSLEGIQYRGLMSAEYMISFFDKFINPFVVLSSEADISKFLFKHDIGVVGFFDFYSSPQPPGYQVFFHASMKALEKDPRQQIRFAVITNAPAAAICNFTQSSAVKLFELHNASMRNYPANAPFDVENLMKWIFHHNHQVVPILNPPGVKSLLFSNIMSQMPVAILLAPDNPLFSRLPELSVFREVVLDYFNCQASPSIQWAINQNWLERQKLKLLDQELEKTCKKVNEKIPDVPVHQCCQSVVVQKYINVSEQGRICDMCLCHQKNRKSSCLLHNINNFVFQRISTLQGCSVINPSYNPLEEIILCCHSNNASKPFIYFQTTCLSSFVNSIPNHDNYAKEHQNYKCRLQRFGKHFQNPLFGSKASLTSLPWNTLDNFSGLGCRTNKTLKFFTLDTRHFSAFMEKLGLHSKGIRRTRGELVILDRLNEMQFVLASDLTHFNIAQFIWNYTYNQLDRFFRSSSTTSSSPLSCDNSKNCAKVCLVEITSSTFQQIVLDESKDVVLLYFTPWCGFCAGIAHIYLSVARYFRLASKLLFARINADANDLPWEFTVESYPTIIFFPAQRKSESVAFPSHLPITFQNLVRFILVHAQKTLKLQTAVTICSRTCIENNRKVALLQIRSLHNDITNLKFQIQRLQMHRNNVQNSSKSERQKHYWIAIFQDYIIYLKREVRRKNFQSHNTKLLHKILAETKGLFIDAAKLSDLMLAFNNYHHVLKNMNFSSSIPKKDDLYDRLKMSTAVKDEL